MNLQTSIRLAALRVDERVEQEEGEEDQGVESLQRLLSVGADGGGYTSLVYQ